MNTTKKIQYRAGSVIAYSPFGGGERFALVEERDPQIKNGRPGFHAVEVDRTTLEPLPVAPGDVVGNGVWGYDDQIRRVVRQ